MIKEFIWNLSILIIFTGLKNIINLLNIIFHTYMFSHFASVNNEAPNKTQRYVLRLQGCYSEQ